MTEVEQWVTELLKISDIDEKMSDKQLRIIQAAVDSFSEKGYASTSTSEIAQKAGVAEGTIFRHYKTKKDLLLSIVAPMISKLVAPFVLRDFQKVIDSPYTRFEDFLKAVIVNRLEFAKTFLPIIKIMLHEIPFHPELKEHFKELVSNQVLERMKKIVTQFQKEEQIVPLPPLTVIRLITSSIIGFLAARLLIAPEYPWDEEKETELTIDFIMHGLAAKR